MFIMNIGLFMVCEAMFMNWKITVNLDFDAVHGKFVTKATENRKQWF